MGNIQRWTITRCPECGVVRMGGAVYCGLHGVGAARPDLERIEVVRADDYQGAVGALRLIAEHARLDHAERGIAEAERYAVLAEDALSRAGGQ